MRRQPTVLCSTADDFYCSKDHGRDSHCVLAVLQAASALQASNFCSVLVLSPELSLLPQEVLARIFELLNYQTQHSLIRVSKTLNALKMIPGDYTPEAACSSILSRCLRLSLTSTKQTDNTSSLCHYCCPSVCLCLFNSTYLSCFVCSGVAGSSQVARPSV